MSACIQILSAIGPVASASERWTRGLTAESMLPALAISSFKLWKHDFIETEKVKIALKTSMLRLESASACKPNPCGWRTQEWIFCGLLRGLPLADLAFSPSLIDAAKLGILSASVISAVAGVVLLSIWSARGKYPKISYGS